METLARLPRAGCAAFLTFLLSPARAVYLAEPQHLLGFPPDMASPGHGAEKMSCWGIGSLEHSGAVPRGPSGGLHFLDGG